MKYVLGILLCSAWLAGCSSGTPACGDSETLDLIDEAIVEAASKFETSTGNPGFAEVAENYEISNVRALAYDDRVDSYQCDARITYSHNGGQQSIDFEYRVDTDQTSGETLLEYENKMLSPIAIFALSN